MATRQIPAAPTKGDLAADNDRLAKQLQNIRKSAKAMEESAKEHAGMLLSEGGTLVTAAVAGWASGYYGESWTILGADPSLVVGVPAVIGGVVASFMGFPVIGEGILAFGRGCVVESVVRRSIAMGQEKARQPAGAGAGARAASGAAVDPADPADPDGDGKPGRIPAHLTAVNGGRPVHVSPRASRAY